MRISTLSIGDEVLYGDIVDTNSPWIAARLFDNGFKVRRHQTVGDSEQDIIEAIGSMSQENDLVIATGGLGPTIDDLTARSAARAANRHLVLNEMALEHLREFLAKRGREVTPANEKQALIPAKAELVPNPTGTACGFSLPIDGCLFVFLPGVPSEMELMVDESVIPMILHRTAVKKTIRVKVLKVFGLPEAEIDTMLKGVVDPGLPVTVAFQVVFPEIRVKFRAEGDDETEIVGALDLVYRNAAERLRNNLFAEDDETMDSVVATLFREKGITLSLAESCTGGYLAKRITDMPGSSAYFIEGAVTYANSAKMRALEVPAQLLEEKGAVSSEVAMAMARGIRRQSGSDIALAITGIAGPGGGSEEKPPGTVAIALATAAGCQAKIYRFNWDRDRVRTLTVFMALNWLRRHLLTL